MSHTRKRRQARQHRCQRDSKALADKLNKSLDAIQDLRAKLGLLETSYRSNLAFLNSHFHSFLQTNLDYLVPELEHLNGLPPEEHQRLVNNFPTYVLLLALSQSVASHRHALEGLNTQKHNLSFNPLIYNSHHPSDLDKLYTYHPPLNPSEDET